MFSIFLFLLFFPISSSYYYQKEVLDDYFFEGVSDEFVDWYMNFTYPDDTFDTILAGAKTYSYYISGPGVFIIIFHLSVLTRKSMMTSSTNILLIAITIGDLGYLLCEVVRYLNTNYEHATYLDNLLTPTFCIPPVTYNVMLAKWYVEITRNYLNRASAWFGVLLAAVRCMVIRSTMATRSATLISPRFGWIVTFTTFLFCLQMPVIEVLSYTITIINTWTPGPTCSINETRNMYRIDFNTNFPLSKSTIGWIDATLFQFVPSVAVVFFTVLLVLEFQKARQRMLALKPEGVQSRRITILVLLIAISFLFVRILQATVTILNNWAARRIGFIDVFQRLPNFVNLSFTINSILHFVICACLSSQYREAAKKMICVEKVHDQPAIPVEVILSKTAIL